MASETLQVHNDARANAPGRSRPPLIWSDRLADRAQAWANHLAAKGKMEQAPHSGDGENLYGSTGNPSFIEAVNAWVAERQYYHGEKIKEMDADQFQKVGHYTQVVWPDTTNVGMGMATSWNGWTYVVARYSSPGNMQGKSAWPPGPSSNVQGGGGGGEGATVTVQAGDTLRDIAGRYGCSFEEIVRHNRIPDPDMIYPGQVLHVPGRFRGGGGSFIGNDNDTLSYNQ